MKEKYNIFQAARFCLVLIFSFLFFFTIQTTSVSAADPLSRIKEGSGQGQHVFDMAGLLTEEEAGTAEAELEEFISSWNMDAVIVTVNGQEGYQSPEAYADHLFYDGGLGLGEEHSGVLLLIDMEERDIFIYTHGISIRYYTDDRLDDILNNGIIPCLSEGNYPEAMHNFTYGLSTYAKEGIPDDQVNYNEDTGEIDPYHKRKKSLTLPEILISAVTAFLAGIFPTKAVKSKYAMKAEKTQAEGFKLAYRAEAAFAFTEGNKAAQLIDKRVTAVPIPRPQTQNSPRTSSGGHTSTVHMGGGGSVHGGKGGKF